MFVQPDCDAKTLEFECGSLPTDISDSDVPSSHYTSCRCDEHLLRIADLEGRLSLLKWQANTAMDLAGESFGLMKEVSSLESQVSDFMAKIIHLEECDAFLIGIIESARELLQCKFFGAPDCLMLYLFNFICLNLLFSRYLLGPCCWWYVQNVSTFLNPFAVVFPLICVFRIQLTRTNAVFSRIALVSRFCAEIQLSGKISENIAKLLFYQKTHRARRGDGEGSRGAHTTWWRGPGQAVPGGGVAASAIALTPPSVYI
jgi:hypothetical protein